MGMANLPVGKWTRTTTRNASYFSGADVRIYFGDEWIDEITELEYTLSEQVMPIYGYASHTFDKVARGNRIVQGSFAINFKEVGYLQIVLNSLSSTLTANKSFTTKDTFNKTQSLEIDGKTYKDVVHKNIPAEYLIKDFDKLAESYENRIWGADPKHAAKQQRTSYFYGNDESDKALRDKGFNILIGFGGVSLNNKMATCHSTTQSIVGVQITSVSTRVDPSGQPVQEVYQFIAEDIGENVTIPY
jgi:hypothetical protein